MKEKIIIFGAGDNFLHHYTFLKDKYDILAVLDNSPAKQGMKFGELQVVPLRDMPSVSYDKVIVTPNAFSAIIQQLRDAGVPGEKIFRLTDITQVSLASRGCRLAFLLNGGLGDYLISANYLYILRQKYFVSRKIDLYCDTGATYAEHVFSSWEAVDRIEYLEKGAKPDLDSYAMAMKISRYPEILRADKEVLAKFCPDFIDYLLACEKFRIFNKRFFQPGLMADGQGACLSEIGGISRIQQPDIYHILGIGLEYRYPLAMRGTEDVLARFGLEGDGYITLHRGADARYAERSVKLWPVEKYNSLLRKLRERFPALKIVQLGTEAECYPGMDSASIDLRGRTSFEELKVLLGRSRLHIDNEGGLVHLRHALHGGTSIVLFGPTSEKFFGYPENRNLRGNGCVHWCEWATDNWQEHCPRGEAIPPCMASISASVVMKEVISCLEGKA